MNSFLSSISFLLIFNSFVLIGLVFIQNENAKEILSKESFLTFTIIEQATFASIFLQFSFLLIKIKNSPF